MSADIPDVVSGASYNQLLAANQELEAQLARVERDLAGTRATLREVGEVSARRQKELDQARDELRHVRLQLERDRLSDTEADTGPDMELVGVSDVPPPARSEDWLTAPTSIKVGATCNPSSGGDPDDDQVLNLTASGTLRGMTQMLRAMADAMEYSWGGHP